MKQYFDLDAAEKRLEWILWGLFALFTLVIAIGVYTQSHGIDYDHFLTPAFFLICGLFFAFYGNNGLRKGNLVAKWTPFYIYQPLKFLLAKLGSFEAGRAANTARSILGVAGLLVAVFCISVAVWDIVKK